MRIADGTAVVGIAVVTDEARIVTFIIVRRAQPPMTTVAGG